MTLTDTRIEDPLHRVAMTFERDGDSLWVTSRLEEFLTESAWAAQEGLYNARSLPTSLRGAAWMSEFALRFADETVMCSPPPALQRVVLPVAARLTRRWR